MSSLDGTEFEQLYAECFFHIYSWVKKYVGTREAAEDITAEAFTRVWNKAGTDVKNLRGFLTTVARNCTMDYLRKMKNSRKVYKELSTKPEIEEMNIDFGDDDVKAEVLRIISEEIASLGPNMRKVMELSYFRGFSNEQIQEVLGITNQHVRNTKSRALKIIRGRLLERGANLALVLSVLGSLSDDSTYKQPIDFYNKFTTSPLLTISEQSC